MAKNKTIEVKQTIVNIIDYNGEEYISLTDMLKAKEGQFFIDSWLRNRNTVEFLGVWESLNNTCFNYVEFDVIRSKAGLNSFKMSVKEWSETTGAIGLIAKTGRYGGTYAHKDIAFEFGMWISPEFKLLLIKEFQRLKDNEAKLQNSEWDYRRFLSKANYRIQTDAIKENIIPHYTDSQKSFLYSNEAELLNVVIFGKTSKQWREENIQAALDGKNMRDLADVIQLNVLANMESYNAILIKQGASGEERFSLLKETATTQFKSLSSQTFNYPIMSPHALKYEQTASKQGDFDISMKGLLNTPPPRNEED